MARLAHLASDKTVWLGRVLGLQRKNARENRQRRQHRDGGEKREGIAQARVSVSIRRHLNAIPPT
jgi:hypothetical protein